MGEDSIGNKSKPTLAKSKPAAVGRRVKPFADDR